MLFSELNRRARRSNDPITALHYQLAYARHHGGFDALVLVDQSGVLVAGAGAWPICEELAAFAPLLAEDGTRPLWPSEIYKLRPQVRLQVLRFQGTTVLLAARGPGQESLEDPLETAATGCLRILSSAPAIAA